MKNEKHLNGFIITEEYKNDQINNAETFAGGYVETVSGSKIISHLNAPVDLLPLSINSILVVETEGTLTYLIVRTSHGIDVHTYTHVPYFGTEIENPPYILTEDLQEDGLIIIQNGDAKTKYYLVDYLYGSTLSAGYDKMVSEAGTIFVENYLVSQHDSLCGELDKRGHLIDDTMRLRKIRTDVLVDEYDMNRSLKKVTAKYPRLSRKYQKREMQKKLIDYEYEAYKRNKEKR